MLILLYQTDIPKIFNLLYLDYNFKNHVIKLDFDTSSLSNRYSTFYYSIDARW